MASLKSKNNKTVARQADKASSIDISLKSSTMPKQKQVQCQRGRRLENLLDNQGAGGGFVCRGGMLGARVERRASKSSRAFKEREREHPKSFKDYNG